MRKISEIRFRKNMLWDTILCMDLQEKINNTEALIASTKDDREKQAAAIEQSRL